MPSQMGNKRVTVQNIRVLEVLPEKNLLVLKGAVPGSPWGHLIIRQSAKKTHRPFALPVTEPAPAAAPAEG